MRDSDSESVKGAEVPGSRVSPAAASSAVTGMFAELKTKSEGIVKLFSRQDSIDDLKRRFSVTNNKKVDGLQTSPRVRVQNLHDPLLTRIHQSIADQKLKSAEFILPIRKFHLI